MGKMQLVVICTVMLCLPVSAQGAKETKEERPSKATVLSAIDLAARSLKSYQLTLGKFHDIQEVAATAETDSQPVLAGGMAVILLQSKLAQGQGVRPLELATLFANVDAAAINAALTTSSLAGNVAANATRAKGDLRRAEAAQALIGNVQELKESSDQLWTILEAYLKSEKPWRVAMLLQRRGLDLLV